MFRTQLLLIGRTQLLLIGSVCALAGFGCHASAEPEHAASARAKPAKARTAPKTEQYAAYRADLDVSGMSKADAELARRIVQRFSQHPYLGSTHVTVLVKDGTARLSGRVESDLQRQTAQSVAAQIAGVSKVVNELRVRAPWEASDQQMVQAVRREIAKHPALRQSGIDVSARGGVITLRGALADWDAYDALMEAVYRAGPSGVKNEIDVADGKADEAQFVAPREPVTPSDADTAASSTVGNLSDKKANRPTADQKDSNEKKPAAGGATESPTEVDKADAEPGDAVEESN
jgi:osmotically-inducible protein OsmY